MYAIFRHSHTGTVWFDDLKLQEVPETLEEQVRDIIGGVISTPIAGISAPVTTLPTSPTQWMAVGNGYTVDVGMYHAVFVGLLCLYSIDLMFVAIGYYIFKFSDCFAFTVSIRYIDYVICILILFNDI